MQAKVKYSQHDHVEWKWWSRVSLAGGSVQSLKCGGGICPEWCSESPGAASPAPEWSERWKEVDYRYIIIDWEAYSILSCLGLIKYNLIPQQSQYSSGPLSSPPELWPPICRVCVLIPKLDAQKKLLIGTTLTLHWFRDVQALFDPWPDTVWLWGNIL